MLIVIAGWTEMSKEREDGAAAAGEGKDDGAGHGGEGWGQRGGRGSIGICAPIGPERAHRHVCPSLGAAGGVGGWDGGWVTRHG